MKKMNLVIILSLLCSSTQTYANNATVQAKDTLASRHPVLTFGAALILKQWYANTIDGVAGAANLIDMADFSLALLAPSALGESGSVIGSALFVVSAFAKHPSQIAPVGVKDFQASPLHPIWYAGTLSHISNDIRIMGQPWVKEYSNHTVLQDYTEATQYLVPAAMTAVPFLGHYLVRGNFQGLAGAMTQGAGYKTAFLLCDGFEKVNIIALRKALGDEVWIEPVAQLETSVLLSISAYGLNALGLAQTLSRIAGEVAGYQAAASAFNAIDKLAPEYAPYVNPALGATLIVGLTHLYLHGGFKSQHTNIKAAAAGATFAGFLQIFSAFFQLPGWIEDAPSQLWDRIKQTIPIVGMIPGGLMAFKI